MPIPPPSDPEEDPNAENPSLESDSTLLRLQEKMRRLLRVSLLIMLLGFLAVVLAILYKVTHPSKPSASSSLSEILRISHSARIKNFQLYEGHLFLLVEDNEGPALLTLDPTTGGLLQRSRFLQN